MTTPKNIIHVVDDSDGPAHVAKKTYLNGEELLLGVDGFDISSSSIDTTAVTLEVLAEEVHFVGPLAFERWRSEAKAIPAPIMSGGAVYDVVVHNADAYGINGTGATYTLTDQDGESFTVAGMQAEMETVFDGTYSRTYLSLRDAPDDEGIAVRLPVRSVTTTESVM